MPFVDKVCSRCGNKSKRYHTIKKCPFCRHETLETTAKRVRPPISPRLYVSGGKVEVYHSGSESPLELDEAEACEMLLKMAESTKGVSS